MPVPYADNGWDEITTGLYMGGHDKADGPATPFMRAPVVVANEFDVVISLYRRDGHGPAAGIEHHYLNILDGLLSPDGVTEVERLADLAAERRDAGKTVLVRCQAGLNRSGLVVALTLMRSGFNAVDAIEEIRDRRARHALFNNHFVDYLTKRP